jgi:hypothetical protein
MYAKSFPVRCTKTFLKNHNITPLSPPGSLLRICLSFCEVFRWNELLVVDFIKFYGVNILVTIMFTP